MKKILPWSVLLMLLIVFCAWTKKDSVFIVQKIKTKVEVAPKVVTQKNYIDYEILQQDDKKYILNGHFKNTNQQISLSATVSKADRKLLIKDTSTDKNLFGEDAILLTRKILPHFISEYMDGKITYMDGKLKIFGTVKTYEAQHEMQRLLNSSVLASQDNSSVVIIKPMEYTISKLGDNVDLTGIFHDKAQVDAIKRKLPPQTTTDFKIASNYVDDGSLAIVDRLLVAFVTKYTNGKIVYSDKKLHISGMVRAEKDLQELGNLFTSLHGLVQDGTIVDPVFVEAARLKALKIKEMEAEAKKLAEKELDLKNEPQQAEELEVEEDNKSL